MSLSEISKRFPALVVLCLCLATSCTNPAPTVPEAPGTASVSTSSDPLLQKWTRSYEEEDRNSRVQIFRRSDSREWEASWFRMRYEFEDSGICQLLILHAADAHYMASGHWKRLADDRNMLRIEGGQPVHQIFQIVELTTEVLRLKPL